MFLKSVVTSYSRHTSEYLVARFKEVIKLISKEKVISIIIDNAKAIKAVTKKV